MMVIIRFMLSAGILSLASCIYIVEEKKTLSSEDSSAAFAWLDSARIADSTRIADSLKAIHAGPDSVIQQFFEGKQIDTRNVQPQQVIDYARTLIGVPYKYASTDPKHGFDCSGFITYVFKHFGIIVPRSSIDFTEVGLEVTTAQAMPGDLILFTGTDSTEKFVGHMGIIVSNQNGRIEFIHSTSGKAYGVTITPLSDYYMSRYVKTIRIFPQNMKR